MMGVLDWVAALYDSVEVLRGFKSTFTVRTLIGKVQKVGEYTLSWGGKVSVVASKPIAVLGWEDSEVSVGVSLKEVRMEVKTGEVVGVVGYRGILGLRSVCIDALTPRRYLNSSCFNQ